MSKLIKVLAFAGLAALTSCTQAPVVTSAGLSQSPNDRQCFLAYAISSYRPAGNGAVDVQVANQWFRLHFNGVCPSMDWMMQIAVRPRDSRWLCEGEGTLVMAPEQAGMPGTCRISQVERLTGPGMQQSMIGR